MQNHEPLLTPAGYRPEFAEKARKWALMRATDEDLARLFGIPLATLHEWSASVPEFARAVEYGRKEGDTHVVERFRQIAMGCFPEVVTRLAGAEKEPLTYTRFRPPNRAARNFWRANRRPGEWCQKVEIEPESGHDGVRQLTRSELKRLITECAAARGSAVDG
jgi:hypothetical protein